MKRAIILVAIFIGLVASASATNLVVNGGFETGDLTGWSLTTTADPSCSDAMPDPSAAHSGAYGMVFGAYCTPSDYDTITQTLATTPGATYNLSFWVSNTVDSGNPADLQASWNGTTLYDASSDPFGFTELSFSVVATGTSTDLAFKGFNPMGYYSLDDVSVVDPTAAAGGIADAPEPGSIMLLGTGLLGLAGVVRRKIRQ